ncbi:DUF4179 domain-containing protein [Paenibacillus sp. NFR01]|uniref:DUF4179 domain-containing protein n=1 Tax=Paenibacillus sp. NFR01 TaxID=1566279 RepID=UPI0008CC1E12|nr:DUF4179 domain-containing protein [Paenibacillus sp. NFR01]SET48085.1 protein of unknown function [Paenibacillus sp. NFR01]
MIEAEEKRLSGYFAELADTADKVPEYRLDAALAGGMERAQRKSRGWRRSYAAVAFAVMALLIAASLLWRGGAEPVTTTAKDWGALEVYRPLVGNNLTIRSALDAGMVQEMDVSSPVVKGMQLTVNGVIADRRGIILLYSLNNEEGRNMFAGSFELKDKANSLTPLSSSNYSNFSPSSESHRAGEPGRHYESKLIPWKSELKQLPDILYCTLTLVEMGAESEAGGGIAKLNVALDLRKDADYSRGSLLTTGETFIIKGQKITLENVYAGPTGIYMTQVKDRTNTMRIFSLYNPSLWLGQGKWATALGESGGYSLTNRGETVIYHTDNMRGDEPLIFRTEGMVAIALDNDELIIDIDKGQVIEAPDKRITVTKVETDKGEMAVDVLFPLHRTEEGVIRGPVLNQNYSDGDGSGHLLGFGVQIVKDPTSNFEYIQENDSDFLKVRIHNLEPNLPQPLTFRFEYYPNLIKEKVIAKLR